MQETCRCTDCGAVIQENCDVSQARVLCIKCGSNRRTYRVAVIETVTARDGHGLKGKRQGHKKPYIEERSCPDYSRSREKFVHLQRTIDRDNDHYFEKVTDYDSGEVIHHCEEPLSQHRGHGDAKCKNNNASQETPDN